MATGQQMGAFGAWRAAKEDCKLVVAIHIGYTHSGYAFSFKHDYRMDPSKVSLNASWAAGSMSLKSLKTPTCVLFDDQQEFHSFGFEAENYYTELLMDEEHQNWRFFKLFKIQLHGKEIPRGPKAEDDQGRTMPVMKVFGESIRYMKRHCLDYLRSRGTCVEDSDIHWVLTIPVFCSSSARLLMREAAYMADIADEQLSIASEPEAASLYCQYLPTDKIHGSKQKFDLLRCGSTFMVIDLGGRTADFTVYQCQKDGSLHKLLNDGGPWGGDSVDRKFFRFIIKIVGDPVFKKFKDENAQDYLALQEEFEAKKRVITSTIDGRITLTVPMSIVNTYKEEENEDIMEGVENSPFKGKVHWARDKLRMNADIFKGLFFEEYCEDIVKKMKQMLSYSEVKGTNTFLMVGGFSGSAIMQDAIMNAFPTGNVIIPEEPEMAVLKGAVIFGHQPQPVVEISRVA